MSNWFRTIIIGKADTVQIERNSYGFFMLLHLRESLHSRHSSLYLHSESCHFMHLDVSCLITNTRVGGTNWNVMMYRCCSLMRCLQCWAPREDRTLLMLIFSFLRVLISVLCCMDSVLLCQSFCIYYFSSASLVWLIMSPVLRLWANLYSKPKSYGVFGNFPYASKWIIII